MNSITYKTYTLGCKVNQYDSSYLARQLDAQNFLFQKENADLVIINTCAVTKQAISKARRMINLARKENPKAFVVLMGCWPKVYIDEIDRQKLKIDLIWQTGKLAELIKEISKNFKKNQKSRKNIPLKFREDKARYFIKIQDGCEQFCSYCIIPYTRGKLKSRDSREILDEIQSAIEAGYREIVLSGIHLGLYGVDLDEKINLADLIKKILKLKNLGRIRLSSIEVTEISDELIELMQDARICDHLHIPVQSGSDQILSVMNRPYDTDYFRKKILEIKKIIPDIAISTDIIVGFPGESVKDFLDSKNFLENIGFSKVHVFPFSAHEKTPAFSLPYQVSKKEKWERSKELRKLGERLEKEFKQKFKNKKLNVLIELECGSDEFIGKSEYYFDVKFLKSSIISKKINCDKLIGQIVGVKNFVI